MFMSEFIIIIIQLIDILSSLTLYLQLLVQASLCAVLWQCSRRVCLCVACALIHTKIWIPGKRMVELIKKKIVQGF